MDGDLRVRVGARSLVLPRPTRVVFGRRHTPYQRPIGEHFLPLGALETMSRRWFSVEDVRLTTVLDDQDDGSALMVRCESAGNGLQVWDGADPVRLPPGARYLARGAVLFVGDLLDGRIWGARLETTAAPPQSAATSGAVTGGTERPPPLDLPAFTSNVLMARYHRYYRHPPDFDPQPVPWGDVAVQLGLLELRETADRVALRRALKDPQEAVGKVKQQVEQIFPGWLPTSSETQKTFHDHLRTVLEMRGFFDVEQLRGFDERFPADRRGLAPG